MKLNLLPTYVSKGKATKTAVILSSLIVLGSIGATIGMAYSSQKLVQQNRTEVEELRPRAELVVTTNKAADDILAQPAVQQVLKNTALANAMIQHNGKYPAFYNRFLRYVPPFFRVTSVAATPVSAEQSSVVMQGVIQNYQQYADLMLAMMRYPNAISIQRSGFVSDDPVVPALNEQDQVGAPLKPGETPLPTDPSQRLAALIARAQPPQGYVGTGNFGAAEGPRQAAPGYSLITVQMVVKDNLQVPNINGTIGGGGGASTAPSGGGFGAPTGFPGAGGAPSGPPTGGARGGGGSRGDDE